MSTNELAKDKAVDVARSIYGGYSAASPGYWQADFTTGVLPSGVSFSRASSGAYFDSGGNLQSAGNDTPRFSYNTGTLTPRGLLLEGSRTNSLFNSASPATQTRTLATGTYVLWVVGSGSCAVAAGIAAGTGFATATAGSSVTFTVTTAGTCVFTVSGTLTRFQCEKGEFASSFISTGGAAATRSMDLCIISNLATLGYNSSEWTLVAEFEFSGLIPSTIQRVMQISDGTATNRYNLGTMTSNVLNGSSTGNASMSYGGSPTPATVYKAAVAYKANDNVLVVNGTVAGTDTTSTQFGGMTVMGIGYDGFGSAGAMFGHVRKLAYYPSRLTNAQMQSLTT